MMYRKRPKWADSLRLWFTDGQYDHLDEVGAANWEWTWHEWLEKTGLWVLCRAFGHEVIADQCRIPAHDFCVCCHKVMPGQAWQSEGT